MQQNNKIITYLFVFFLCYLLTLIKSGTSTVLNSEYPWLRLPPTPELPYPHYDQYVQINNNSIWYTIYGPTNGVPVLFLHGGLANSNYWGLQVQQLQSTYKCILMDSRAHGRSPSSSANLTYDLMASDVVHLLDLLGLNKVNVVGWSDGANIGLDLAMKHPDRLYSLFAFGANYKPSDEHDKPMPPVFAAYLKRAQAEYESLNPSKKYQILLNDLLTMWANYPKWTEGDLSKIPSDLPVWIVDGDHEEAINREQTDTIARWIPQAGEFILPRTSHFAFIQDPDGFTTALERFLAEVTHTTTRSKYHFLCANSGSVMIAHPFFTLVLIFTFRSMFEYSG